MLQQILTITQEIKNIESKNIDLSKLTMKDQKILAKLYKELELLTKDHEKIQEENKQLKDQWTLKSKENIMLTARNNELTKLTQKEKTSYSEIIKKFIINLVTNLVTFGLLKAILKRTVNPYLEKLISYVLMGVLFNNIFGNYFGFLYEILSQLLNIESIKPLLSMIGITTFTDYFKYIYDFIKRIYSSIVYESLHTPLGVINEENEIKMDKQLELDRLQTSKQLEIDNLQKSNEELIKKLELFSKELQDELNNEKDPEQTKTWINFFEKIGKDFGKTAYDSLKILIISVLIKHGTDLIFKNGEFTYLKDLLTKYFNKKDNSDSTSDDSLSYFSESDVKIIEDKEIQTENNKDIKSIQTDIIDDNSELNSSMETIKPSKDITNDLEITPRVNPANIPLPSPIDNELVEESCVETDKGKSNITTTIDKEQIHLSIDSQADQGYVNISVEDQVVEAKRQKILEDMAKAAKKFEHCEKLEARIQSLDPKNDLMERLQLIIEHDKYFKEARELSKAGVELAQRTRSGK
jgi:hypothetical protein